MVNTEAKLDDHVADDDVEDPRSDETSDVSDRDVALFAEDASGTKVNSDPDNDEAFFQLTEYHRMVLAELVLETIPQFLLQYRNSTRVAKATPGTGGLTIISRLSLATSIVFIMMKLWWYLYYMLLRQRTLADVPIANITKQIHFLFFPCRDKLQGLIPVHDLTENAIRDATRRERISVVEPISRFLSWLRSCCGPRHEYSD